MAMNAQTNTAETKFQVGDLVSWKFFGGEHQGAVGKVIDNSVIPAYAEILVGDVTHRPDLTELTLIERKHEQTREGGKERTAAARSTSREFQPGDTVALTHAFAFVRGTVIGVVDSEVGMYRVAVDGRECVRLGSDLTRVDDTPLLLADEPLDLGDVDDDDALIGASLDAVALIVRIAAADDQPIRERVTINGVTWLVDVRPE